MAGHPACGRQLAQGAPVAIDAREQRVDLELAAEHPAAEDGRVEARALLVHHAADRERPTGATGLAKDGLDGNERGDHPQRAVVCAAVEHRVYV